MQKTPNDALPRLTVDAFLHAEKNPFVVVLDNVRSLNNIGSVFRTADAFLLSGICLCGITATPPHRDIEKTALGATANVVWEYFDHTVDAIRALKDSGYKIYAVEQTDVAVYLQEFRVEKGEKAAFVFGHEVMGVSDDVLSLCDGCIEIPQFGTKHSLNIAVSVGIVLWDVLAKVKYG
ncbi:MAG: RNA methyltransferase [Chitinophagales bacterium]